MDDLCFVQQQDNNTIKKQYFNLASNAIRKFDTDAGLKINTYLHNQLMLSTILDIADGEDELFLQITHPSTRTISFDRLFKFSLG